MAEQYLVNRADMVSVADAIRGKAGVEDELTFPAGFVGAVEGIQAGGGGGGDIDALIDGTITEIHDDNVTVVKQYTFYSCIKLTSAVFLRATKLDMYSFQYCTNLYRVELPSVTDISTRAFQYCHKLATLILRGGNVASLAGRAIDETAIASGTGYIYVPAALIDSYKAASGWSTYAAQFRALEDYTVDGTVTGELDESKI